MEEFDRPESEIQQRGPQTTRVARKSQLFNNDVMDSDKLRRQEIEYLKSIAESGDKIPKEKINLFKLLILKEDPIKIGEAMLKKNLYVKNSSVSNFSLGK